MKLPKEQKRERGRKKVEEGEEGKEEEEKRKECHPTTLLWEDGGFTSINHNAWTLSQAKMCRHLPKRERKARKA